MSDLTHSQKLINFYDKKRRLFYYIKVIPLLRIGYTIPQIFKTLKKDDGTIRLYFKKYASEFDKKNVIKNKQNYVFVPLMVKKFNEKVEQYYEQILNLIDNGYTSVEISKVINYDLSFFKDALIHKNNNEYLDKLKNNGIKKKKEALKNPKTIKASQKTLKKYYFKKYLKKMSDNKKYYPLIFSLLKSNKSLIDIEYYFNKFKIKMYRKLLLNLINFYGGKSLHRRAKINGAIQLNQHIFVVDEKKLTKRKTSKDEIRFKNIIKQYIPSVVWQYEIKIPETTYYADVADVNNKIIFEYDGIFWHDEEKDRIRDNRLFREGWKVLRFVFSGRPSDKKINDLFLNKLKKFDLLHIIS